MKQSSSKGQLPATLAQRIQFLREQRMMSREFLAHKALVPTQTIEDIEAGIETFLAPSVRQRLARVLHVRPSQIQEVETPPEIDNGMETAMLRRKGLNLHEAILAEPDAPHLCPSCGAPLAVRLFERRDLQNNPITVVKANCTRCLFRLTDD